MPRLIYIITYMWVRVYKIVQFASLLEEVFPDDSVTAKCYTVRVLICKITALCDVRVAQAVVYYNVF